MTDRTTSVKPMEALCDAAMRLDGIYGAFAKRHGETYMSMWVICELGDRPEGLTQKQLAGVLYSPKQTVGSIIASLERRGLVRTVSSTNDRRSKIHLLTDRGEALFDEANAEQNACEDACIQRLGRERVGRMIADIDATLTCIEHMLGGRGVENGTGDRDGMNDKGRNTTDDEC